eukprot:Gb_16727 [translate_table: standard]
MAVESSSGHRFMGKSRQSFLSQEISPDSSVKFRDWDNTSRWSESFNTDVVSPSTSSNWKHTHSSTPSSSRNFQKARHIQMVFQLVDVAEGLMAKMYRLNQKLDFPEPTSYQFSDSFWKAGVVPNYPKLCVHITKKFPEHPGKLQLERVDKLAFDALYDNVEVYLENLEPWLMLLLDLMTFREQALRLILDLSSTVITLLPHQNSLILHAFMDLFCAFVRVNLFSDKVPRKMIVQIYNLLHTLLRSGRDYEFYHRLVQFIDSYDPPLKGLHEDLNFVSPRIGEVLEAVGPLVFLAADTQKLRNEGFLSPFHPRYPDILTNSAHPMRAQDLANVNAHREWVLLGYLVCPSELLRITGIDIATAVLKENLVLTLYRDECILLHEEYQQYVLPKILESKKMAKAGRTKQKEADVEYNLAKQVEKMICDVHDQAILYADAVHRERRTFLKQEIGRMVLFFTDQPSLLAPNIQMVFSALALARSEVMWYFQHIGVASVKSRATRIVSVEIDATDPTIGFLLDGIDKLCCLVRKYVSAIRGYALAYLASAAERIRFLLGTPGMVALDIDAELSRLFQQVVSCLEKLPKPQGENVSLATVDLFDFRKDWLSVLMVVTSSRSSINIRHLEKATISTGKEGLVSEGNAAYVWSRSVDELEDQLSKHACLKQLYYFRQHLTVVFRNTMFGPEGRPQHCCAWLGVASSFPNNATVSVPEEVIKIGRDAVSYVESLIESIMGGLEGLVNILDSEGGFGSLEYKLLPEQAAIRMNHAAKIVIPSNKSMKSSSDLPLPGNESEPANRDSIKMLEAAVQRLTSLCSVLNEMEPICVLNHVFVLREYLRDCVLSNFRRRLITILKIDRDLQRPSVLESLIRRHINIVHLVEQHVSMDLTQGLREVLLSEAFCGPVRGLHSFEKPLQGTGAAVSIICDWYLDNVVKDVNGAGILFTPIDKCFRSARPVGGYFAESVTDLSELKAFVRLFGPYGVDKLDSVIREHLTALLNCIDMTLRSNKESLEALSANIHNWTERDYYLKQVLELETLINFSIQAGQALSFSSVLAEAAGEVLDTNTPLLFSLLSDFTKHLPASLPEREDIRKLKTLASTLGVTLEHDTALVHSILLDMGGAGDVTWGLLPYLYTACMTSNIWNTSAFSVTTGGFNNNVHCLARCINAVIAASEFVRAERKELQRQILSQQQSNGNGIELKELETEVHNLEGFMSVEKNIKTSMKVFIKCSAAIILESWSDNNRSPLVAKLIFLDQLCELSKYLPRSILEPHVPYAILRSIYHQYYENSVPTLVLISPSRRHSLGISLSHSSSRNGQFYGDLSMESSEGGTSNSLKFSAQRKRPVLDLESSNETSADTKHSGSGVRLSGPLDYGGTRKVSFVDTPSSDGTSGPSPLRRFVMSRSGPVTYK